MKIHGETLQEAIENLTALRRYQPYRFGGKLFVAVLKGQAYAYRKQPQLMVKALNLGETSVTVATLQ